jgi:hypothetical protein
MDLFLQALINGVMLGGFYAAMMLGFSVIWGVMGVINLAHGEVIMVGAYLTWALNENFGMDPFVALLLVMPVMFVLGYILQLVLINRVVDRPILVSLLVTFGLSIMIANAMKLIFTADPRLTDTALGGAWNVGNVTFPVTKSMIMVVALAIMDPGCRAEQAGCPHCGHRHQQDLRSDIRYLHCDNRCCRCPHQSNAGGIPVYGPTAHFEGIHDYRTGRIGKHSGSLVWWHRSWSG